MKRMALALALISAALLSGCIIVPVHRHDGYYRDHDGYLGRGYGQPGPR